MDSLQTNNLRDMRQSGGLSFFAQGYEGQESPFYKNGFPPSRE
jgi:hypothetical protein